MVNMKQDLSTHMHGVSLADWGEDLVKQNRTRELTMDQADLEVFQRALSQRNDEAWSQLFARFQGLVLTWSCHDLGARGRY